MATNSGSPSTCENIDLMIEQFCDVTNSSRDTAYEVLEACNWNLERAINRHADSNFLDFNDVNQKSDPVNAVHDDDVKSPVPSTSSGILAEDDSTFHFGIRGRKHKHHSIFDGFGDLQELETAASGENSEKRITVEHLFRPPLDLMYRGTFESARDCGQSSNRWSMVNIQDSKKFACLVLNRDVWSDAAVKSLISEHFVFWQVCTDSSDGKRYMEFQERIEFPYVAVIDPRTGDKLAVWHKIEASTIQDLVEGFLKEYSLPNGTSQDISSTPSDCSLPEQSEDYPLKATLAVDLKSYEVLRPPNASQVERRVDFLAGDMNIAPAPGEDRDVVRVEGWEFRAHRDILTAGSPVFDAMFSHDMLEARTGVVNIREMGADVFACVLSHMYFPLTDGNVLGVYSAADMYDIEALKERCRAYLKNKNMPVSLFCDALRLKNRPFDSELEQVLHEYLRAHSSDIFKSDEFKRLKEENTYLVLDFFESAVFSEHERENIK